MQTFNITDSVALINDERCDEDIRVGTVGTIVEILGKNNNVYEVEFCDKDGKTLVSCAIEKQDLVKLYFN